jgi:hypothetical protein
VEESWARWKPAAGARTHLLLAAMLWSAVGLGLSAAGIRWSLGAQGLWPLLLLLLGFGLGAAKAHFVLDRTAARSAARIVSRGDGKCLGGFLSWQSWAFVLAMIGLGVSLRRSPLPRTLLGIIYTGVGLGLLKGSRCFWAARRRLGTGSSSV